MEIRKLSPELQKKAIEELNEDPQRIQEDLDNLRDWLLKQRHLTTRQDNQLLMSFLRGCKWSLQKAKNKIDCYYTIRSKIPEWFTNKDPFLPGLQKVMEAGIIVPLPNPTLDGHRVLYLTMANAHSDIRNDDLIKLFYMMTDILLKEDDNAVVAGFEMIATYDGIPLSLLTQITPSTVKKQVFYMTRGYPLRPKYFYIINPPTLLITIRNTVLKPFISKKLFNRMNFFSLDSNGKLSDNVDITMFPKEMGGNNGCVAEQKDIWKAKIESYRDWFLEDDKYGSNEKLRIGPSTYEEGFGLEGTFRKLTID